MKTIGYAAHSHDADLVPFHFERRELRDNDVAIDILYCGVCHSDVHNVRNDWGGAVYPMVPGHEIVGKVTAVGSKVKKYKVGDRAAVGCLVDSCLECDQCKKDHEQYCRNGFVTTYNSPDKNTGGRTYGGYSKHIVVREEFVLSIPDNLDISRAAPILCAGVTTFSPLRTWNVKKGSRIGVVGLGGLGHMALKLAGAMGAQVTVITHSPKKVNTALEYGADKVVVSTDEKSMAEAAGSLDLIINTVPVKHDINPYIPLLDVDGTLVMVGQVGFVEEPNTAPLIFGRRRIAGSLIGGIAETQEVIDFCAEHNIYPECKMIRMDEINEAFAELSRSGMDRRYVIDMATLKDE